MKLPIFFISFFLLISCTNPSDKIVPVTSVEMSVSVDSLNALFLAGWNNKDSATIMKTFSSTALVMNDSLIHTGLESIANNWVSGGIRVISNIQTTSLIKQSNNSLAYDGGTYNLDLTTPGGPTLKEKGNYSLCWAKQNDGLWKLALVHIEDISRMPDIK